MTSFAVGDCGERIDIMDGWRVLDVGSGHAPHPRADVLLERFPSDNRHRGGGAIDAADPRLIVGDGGAMPFKDQAFDFVIASHIAEHVDDPETFCKELVRVAARGYLETPGWLCDMLLREEFHKWRVRKEEGGLNFERVSKSRPLGIVGDMFYALTYANIPREGHRTPQSDAPFVRTSLLFVQKVMGRLLRSKLLRPLFYVTHSWTGEFNVTISESSQRR